MRVSAGRSATPWLSVPASLALIFTTIATSAAAIQTKGFVSFTAHGATSERGLVRQMLQTKKKSQYDRSVFAGSFTGILTCVI